MRSKVTIGGKRTLVLTALVLYLGGASLGMAAHHEEQTTTAADVKQEAVQTYDALKDYTLEQRDQAMDVAQKKLNELDRRISEMQKSVDENWQEMSQATREKTRQTLEALRNQREDLAEWLGGIRYSSKAAWEDVKKGFADSYDRMEKAFQEASKDIGSDKAD